MPTGNRLMKIFESVSRYAGFCESDLEILRECHQLVAGCFPEVIDDFYRYVLADDVTRRILEDPERVRRLMRTMRTWLEELFLSPRDKAYQLGRVAIGATHVRVGLPFAYVFAAMSHMRGRLGRAVLEAPDATGATTERRLNALGKALDLDLALISSSYHETDKYRDLVEASPEMIHTVDRSGLITDVNRTVEKKLGVERAGLVGRPLASLVIAADRATCQAHLDEVFSKGEALCELRLEDAKGLVRHVEVLSTAAKDAITNEILIARIWMRDVTERREAELALVRERRLEAKYLEVADVVLLVLDLDGRVSLVNRKGCEVLGGKEEEIVGKDWFETFLEERYRAPGRRTFQRLIGGESDSVREFENPVRGLDGRERIVEWHNTVLTDDHGSVTGTLSSGLDVTERRRMTRELMEKDSLARLGEMAAVVAHEVRNPLAGISGAVQIIGSNLTKDHPDRVIVREIVTRIDALNATVNDILLFARPRLPRPIPIDLKVMCEELMSHVNRDAAFQSVALAVVGDEARVKADPELLKPVLLNLLVNAAQAMREKGSITMRVTKSAERAKIVVADSGPGIPLEIRQKVFEPFFSTKNRGTGLGLSIARRLVEAHGGKISLECPKDGGTEIEIDLPIGGPKLAESGAHC